MWAQNMSDCSSRTSKSKLQPMEGEHLRADLAPSKCGSYINQRHSEIIAPRDGRSLAE
jgi:hypothetical protein